MPDDNVYYVYAKGGLDSTYTDPAQQFLRADEQTGVVLNRAQQYVWGARKQEDKADAES